MAQLPAPVPALMGLQHLTGRQAPRFALMDQYGHTASLGSLRGKVVVLSFFDAACDDICAVLEAELSQAYHDLGPYRSQVALITVNTDPLALALASGFPAEEGTISSVPGWRFLTGSLAQLGPVWTAYGVSIEVQRRTHAVSHNDLLYFIDPAGRLRLQATPFADENASGSFGLSHATEVDWAAGIAAEARSLLGPRP
jgi:protein SCO1/2